MSLFLGSFILQEMLDLDNDIFFLYIQWLVCLLQRLQTFMKIITNPKE